MGHVPSKDCVYTFILLSPCTNGVYLRTFCEWRMGLIIIVEVYHPRRHAARGLSAEVRAHLSTSYEFAVRIQFQTLPESGGVRDIPFFLSQATACFFTNLVQHSAKAPSTTPTALTSTSPTPPPTSARQARSSRSQVSTRLARKVHCTKPSKQLFTN
jgi:hypothetical protein